jgi:heat shock protein HtpX
MMDFYAGQARARKQSRRLAALFGVALVAVVLATNLAALLVWRIFLGDFGPPRHFWLTNTLAVLLVVVGGAWLESLRLREGGAAFALRLGARHLDEYQPAHRRLRNVVEEVAVSAGMAVPEVFVLAHPSINALTAGSKPGQFAIVVTSGALDGLQRDELQAIVAHETAHVLHGDVALHTRLAGALYGFCSLSLLGAGLMRGTLDSGLELRRFTLAGPILVVMGVALLAIGSLGRLAAVALQAGVSRQREYLADARAVHLTRHADALGRALRKILGAYQQPRLGGYAQIAAHLWFASERGANGWSQTHPPLHERIRRVYDYALVPITTDAGDALHGVAVATGDEPCLERKLREVVQPVGSGLGSPPPAPRPPSASDRAAVLLKAARELPASVEQAELLLRALVAGVDPCPAPSAESGPAPALCTRLPAALVDALRWVGTPPAAWLRVPLIEVLAARLRSWPNRHRRDLLASCREAIAADGQIDKSEWIYYTLLRHRLLPTPAGASDYVPPMAEQRRALAVLMATGGRLTEQSARRVRDAVAEAAAELGIPQPATTPDEPSGRSLADALDRLRRLSPPVKLRMLRILAGLARDPGDVGYQAFISAVAAAIDCLPPRRRRRPDEAMLGASSGRREVPLEVR